MSKTIKKAPLSQISLADMQWKQWFSELYDQLGDPLNFWQKARAYCSNGQVLPSGANTVVQLTTVSFDASGIFLPLTYAFRPNKAGYYQVNGEVTFVPSAGSGLMLAEVYKNGLDVVLGGAIDSASAVAVPLNDIISLNGTTDYIQLVASQSTGSPITLQNVPDRNFMSIVGPF